MSAAPIASIPNVPTRAEILARAEALVPVLRERAAACEAARTVPTETIAAFEEAGFYRIAQPRAHGGYEMSPTVIHEVAMILAAGCPSSAWCFCLISVHNWALALFDGRAAEDVWGESDDARISSSYAPFGRVGRAEGGYRIRGRWPWSSGSDHCRWVVLGGLVPAEGNGAPEMRFFLIPRADYEIDDTWFAAGLAGTGSKDIVVDDAYVPEHRTQSVVLDYEGRNPGLETFTGPTFKLPLGVVFAFSLASVVLGIAKGAFAVCRDQLAAKLNAYDGARKHDDPFVRRRLAEADAAIRGAELRWQEVFRDFDDSIARGQAISVERRVSAKWDAQSVAQTAVDAVTLLFKAGGGGAIRLENPLQRYFRDAHAASNHAFLSIDKGSLNAGGVLFGADNADFLV